MAKGICHLRKTDAIQKLHQHRFDAVRLRITIVYYHLTRKIMKLTVTVLQFNVEECTGNSVTAVTLKMNVLTVLTIFAFSKSGR